MDKNLLRYKEFINESFLGGIGSGIKSLFTGARSKIRTIVEEMIAIEKDFIDKTDELRYSLYKEQQAGSRRSSAQSLGPVKKQQELMNKRALEAFERAKNSQMNHLKNQLIEIVDGDKDLVSFYNEETVYADKEVAKYAHDCAKTHRDSNYSASYRQYTDLETLRGSLGGVDNDGRYGDIDGREETIAQINNFSLKKPFSLIWEDFINYIKNKPLEDLIYWKNNGYSEKALGKREFEKIDANMRASIKNLETDRANNPNADAEIRVLKEEREQNTKRMEEFSMKMSSKIELLQKAIKKQTETI